MPTYKSFRYKANTEWSSARRSTLAAAGRPNLVVGGPPEFKGEGGVWAPEELLVGSLNTCMMLTFLALTQARALTPVGYESDAEGVLENVEGKHRIKLAREIIDGVEEQCFISNSICSQVKLTSEFVVAPGRE